jgi:hypothetical protein
VSFVEIIRRLTLLLRSERQAIANLDPIALTAIATEKSALVEMLRTAEAKERVEGDLKQAARMLRAEAEANHALVSEVIETFIEALGLR